MCCFNPFRSAVCATFSILVAKRVRNWVLLATFASLSPLSANATLFNYSYTFQDGDFVSGSFTGTASDNLVTNLSNINANFDGVDFNGSGHLYESHLIGGGWISGGAVVSFDGLANNFNFMDSSDPAGNDPLYSNFFMSAPFTTTLTYVVLRWGAALPGRGAALDYLGDGGYGVYDSTRWTLSAVTPVPEPETYAMLLAGLGLLGFIARRRKQKEVVVA
jgi:PEP-CTERM motif